MGPFHGAAIALLALAPRGQDGPPAAAREGFERQVAPLLEAHCLACHAEPEPEGGLDLEPLTLDPAAPLEPSLMRAMRDALRDGIMPPRRRPRPAPEEVAAAVAWLDGHLAAGRAAALALPPANVPTRRLTGAEYENSVRDLLGVDFDAAAHLPADPAAEGFDTVADGQSLPEALLEKLVLAAEQVAAAATRVHERGDPPRLRLPDDALRAPERVRRRPTGWPLTSNGELSGPFEAPCDGEYVLRVGAWAQQAGPDVARMELRVDGLRRRAVDVRGTRDEPEVHAVRVRLARGERRVGAAFVNDFYREATPEAEALDRNLHVAWIEVEGPLDPPPASAFELRFLSPDAAADPEATLAALGRLVWRRPLEREDVARLLALSDAAEPWPQRVRLALTALLASPRFVLRVEPAGDEARPLDGWELATRLAAFLWSSAPDERLLDLAEDGRLGEPATLGSEVERMLRDARASALARRFAVQWLQLERLARAAPDPTRYPGFDEPLRAAMRAETELFFEAVLREDRAVRELLDADFTFVDARLAAHYGLPGVRDERPRRVRLDDEARRARGGLLGHASVLTATSTPTRTSPVSRGKWVLEALLDAPPPPPPPGVGVLDESPEAAREASLRERLARHRERSECAVCHDRMDPLGFALEGFDAVGARRVSDDGVPIDAHGELPDGRRVEGLEGLRALLADDPAFVLALARRLAVFALGRPLAEPDRAALELLVGSFGGRSPTLGELIQGVVALDGFRMQGARRAER